MLNIPVLIWSSFSSDFPESGFGWEASSCNFAESLSVLAASTGPKTFFRRFALFRFETLARTLLAISKKNIWLKNLDNFKTATIWERNPESVVSVDIFFFFLRLASHWRAENFYVITLSETLFLDLRDHRPSRIPWSAATVMSTSLVAVSADDWDPFQLLSFL